MLSLFLASLTAFAGSVLVYLTSSHQYLLQKGLPKRRTLYGAIGLFISSYLCLIRNYSYGTSAFMLVVMVMCLWSLGPLLIAFARIYGTRIYGKKS